MSIKEKIEGWFFNKLAGKLVARAAVTIAAYLMSNPVQALLAKAGLSLAVDQSELTAGLIAGAHAAYEWFKAKRAASPNSPAVQTDASKPGGNLSAQDTLPKP